MWQLAVLCFFALLVVWMTNWVYRWRNPDINGKLPPGSMGLPLIGETFQFLKSQPDFDIHPFFKNRMKWYGPLFKTNLLGCPIIVSTDPEFSHFIFQQDGISVELWYLDTFMQLIGQQKLSRSTGALHKYLRNLILDHFGPEKQKEKILSELEVMARQTLNIWSKQDSVEVKEAASTMSFGLGSMKLLSYDPSMYSENLKDKFESLLKALISFPLNIPGTLFHKCLKDQRRAIIMLKDIVKRRLNSGVSHGDFLDVVIQEMRKDEPMFTVESAAYFLFSILFASFETVSLAIALAVNFISDQPLVLKELTEEHEAILRSKSDVDSPLTWNDYKSMTFTSHVIDETLRITNIAPVMLRRATTDIHKDGFIIPAGWTIMVCPPAIHLDPKKYEDTLVFNPWRWEGQGSNTASKSFMAFGGGLRLCAGAEFAKLQMSVVLHFMVTKYRWTKIKGGDVIKTPGIFFPNGLHIKVVENNSS